MYYPDLSPYFKQLIANLPPTRIAVIGHVRPDGDSIGSQLALCRCLIALGHQAIAVNTHTIPRILKPFTTTTPFVRPADLDPEDYLAITVDCADRSRLGPELEERFPSIFINVDHHISNTYYATHNIVIAQAAATAEILAAFLIDSQLPLDPVTAQGLYVGVITDTGQFHFSSTTAQVFDISKQLVIHGADPQAAATKLYAQESLAKMQLLGYFLQTLKLEDQGRICIGCIPQGLYDQFQATAEDIEGLVNYTHAIAGVKIGVLLEERQGQVKGSLRAKDPTCRLDQVAKSFHGGGHACAAGFRIDGAIDGIYSQLLESLVTRLKQIDLDSNQ